MNAKQIVVLVSILTLTSGLMADTFGTGDNQFDIDFVAISGTTNPTSGYGIVNNDYRMGIYEITNDQWDKFIAELGVPVTGDPSGAYNSAPNFTGANVPTNMTSWYEAAQFVNWLNTSTGHQAAYKFTGTQGSSEYALATWNATEAAGGTNLYRHKDAKYFLPTEDEWVKAAYWNGTGLQTYATKPGDTLHQGDGLSDTGWNYYDDGYATDPVGPWAVGSGSEELNGTFDMMGNAWEWMENPYDDMSYGVDSYRGLRGGCYGSIADYFASSSRYLYEYPDIEHLSFGFRVASNVPEPVTLSLLAIGGLALLQRKRK